MEEVQLVKAVYDFIKSNTDELNFAKGDVIVVTQKLDGGWWEGTLREETGWFPTSFVTEYRHETLKNGPVQQDPRRQYRSMVLKNLIDSERKHVNDMQAFQRNCLRPLRNANILGDFEFRILCSNIEEIIQLHSILVERLDDITKTPSEQQTVGGLLMGSALDLKTAHLNYCSNHPRAVEVLNRYKETLTAFCETLTDFRGGVPAMTAELSRPFRRLDKYPNMLQELERHLEEFHSDRGNTQRAVMVFTEIQSLCADCRRQKEIELEISNGNIKGYQGPDIGSLGEILLMSQVIVRDEPAGPKQERYLVLFEDCFLMLAASPRMSCFMYMSHSPLSGLKLRQIDSGELPLSFEIWSKTLDRKIIECKDREAFQHWLEALSSQIFKSSSRPAMGKSNTLPKPSKLTVNGLQLSPPKIVPVQIRETSVQLSPRGQRFRPPIITNPVWSGSCLRPNPPLRPDLSVKDEKPSAMSQSPKLPRKFSTRKTKDQVKPMKADEQISMEKAQQYENDALLLGVIDAYCVSSKTRHKITSEVLDSPHVLIAEEEKIFVEGSQGNFLEEKSLVDTVYGLKDELRDLTKELLGLRKLLHEEIKARKHLEASLAHQVSTNGERATEICYQ